MPVTNSRLKIAIIPARAGSQGLPGKNIKTLGNYPLISWTIRAAIASGCFDRVIVSTDSVEIAEISRDSGAEVPFMRPDDLATSKATSADVVQHALTATGTFGDFALLQPTSPFRSAAIIKNAVRLFREKNAQSVLSIVAGKPHNWAVYSNADAQIRPLSQTDRLISRRQDTVQVHYPNGAIYICSYGFFDDERKFIGSHSFGQEMQTIDSLDIDTLEDFQIAEAIVYSGFRGID